MRRSSGCVAATEWPHAGQNRAPAGISEPQAVQCIWGSVGDIRAGLVPGFSPRADLASTVRGTRAKRARVSVGSMAPVRPVSWLREHPRAADVLFAVGLAVLAVIFHLTLHEDGASDPSIGGVLLTIGATLPLAWRRQAPATVLLVVTLFQMAMELENAIGSNWMGVLVASYTLGAYRSGRMQRRISLGVFVAVFIFVLLGVLKDYAPWQSFLTAPITFFSAIALGENMRRRRERAIELTERAERLDRERLMLAHQQVLDERARIAREMHDVVAHNVSLMVIQAAAARRQLANDPAKADEALAVVEDTGRLAMQEMRRMLGVLRQDQSGPELAPQPGLAAIGSLAQTAPDLPVEVHVTGDLSDVPSGVEVNAYRIVQEALTNVRRHAGLVRKVDVSVVRNNGSLTVEVEDDGRGAAADQTAPGFGIVGMQERVTAFGGRLTAGPRTGGGWRVRAVFPVPAAHA